MHEQDQAFRPTMPPRRILLATDLSCRCDRAQQRAAHLAERWGARLHLLHVMEQEPERELPSWRQGRSAREKLAERELRAAARGRSIEAEMVIRTGTPPDVILQTAEELGCELIVTGIARGGGFARAILGSTADRLVHRAPMPVLVVKTRADRAYDHIVVAADFSASSAQAFRQALRLFPDSRMTVLHAYRVPFEGFISKEANRDEVLADARRQCAVFLSGMPDVADRGGGVECLIEYGLPDETIGAYVWDKEADLVVVGTHGSSGVFDILLGSTAERLLESLPCDVLVVREPRSMPTVRTAEGTASRSASAPTSA